MPDTTNSLTRVLLWTAPIALAAACGTGPSVAGSPSPSPAAAFALAGNWRARAMVERDDSIVLTLPSGDRQVQQFHRSAVLTLGIGAGGFVSIRLDSFAIRPAPSGPLAPTQHASWTERADDPQVGALRVVSGGGAADDLTTVVRNLLPRLPTGGARAGTSWADSSTGTTRVDIFNASEHRLANWSAGSPKNEQGVLALPIRVRESYEQMGSGTQGGHRITMTSQGSRSGAYYVTDTGLLTSAQLVDSAAVLISLPDTRQVIPTLRLSRVSVRFVPLARDSAQ